VPKRVDHEQRRRQIADALLRTAAARGLHAAGMREVAAEAGVSLRLVQYYFGTKEELLLFAMQHLAARFGARAAARFKEASGSGGPASPRDVIAAILAEALPADDDRRTFYVVYTAYLALSLTDFRVLASVKPSAHENACHRPPRQRTALPRPKDAAMTTGVRGRGLAAFPPAAADIEHEPAAIAVHIQANQVPDRRVHRSWTDIFNESCSHSELRAELLDRRLVLQRHFVIMRVGRLFGGSGRPGRWPDVVVAIVTSAAAVRVRAAAGSTR